MKEKWYFKDNSIYPVAPFQFCKMDNVLLIL